MHLYYSNVNDAFTAICRGFHDGAFYTEFPGEGYESSDRGCLQNITYHPPLSRGPSRFGSVIRIEEPVTITYTEPLQRLLFHPVRDCNPFFHLIEALWMLAGQNRVQHLSHFAKRMAEFADDDLTAGDIPYRGLKPKYEDFTNGVMWGAYGYRWRNWFQQDQIEQCIKVLRQDRITRRVVLEMWEPRDLQRVATNPECKDVPCNLCIMFSPRSSQDTHRLHIGQLPSPREERRLVMAANQQEMVERAGTMQEEDDRMKGCICLDMTVINRSNDTLWGALGSNYVHFSFLHEYIANACGYAVGYYHQISNNLHIYTNEVVGHNINGSPKWSGQWDPLQLGIDYPSPYSGDYRHFPLYRAPFDDYEKTDQNRQDFDNACLSLFNNMDYLVHPSQGLNISHYYFRDVVNPLLLAWESHKARDYPQAMFHVNQIVPIDWRSACDQWLRRRSTRYTKARSNGVHANP